MKHDEKLNTSGSAGSGTNFYFDYQDSQFGYNTSSLRGADTFHPFKSGGGFTFIKNFSRTGTTVSLTNLTVGKKYYAIITAATSGNVFVPNINVSNKTKLTQITGTFSGGGEASTAIYEFVAEATTATVTVTNVSSFTNAVALFE